MFNLEQSIAEWRKQMLAAGIKTPVPLEELECHLREEIEEQIQSGVNEQQAFETAVEQVGRASELKSEFKKSCGTILQTGLIGLVGTVVLNLMGLFVFHRISSGFFSDQWWSVWFPCYLLWATFTIIGLDKAGFLNWWGEDAQTRINRIFALLWLACFIQGFLSIARPLSALFYESNWPLAISPNLLLALLLLMLCLRGMVASIRLFGGNNKEIRPLQLIAIIGLILFAAQIIIFKQVHLPGIVFAAFNVASLYLLRSPSRQNPGIVTK